MPEISIKELDARIRKHFGNAKLAIERGNFEYTIEICSSILLENPGCIEVRRVLRSAQHSVFGTRGQGVFARTKANLEASVLIVYGKPYLKKRPELAMAYGERALSRAPYHKGALSLVAAGAEKLGLFETAALCLQSVCESHPDDFEHMRRYCEALIKTGETMQAVAIAEKLGRLKPDSGAIQELVKSASVAHSINKGKWAEGEGDFRSKLKDSERAEALERESRMVDDEDSSRAKSRSLIEAIQRDPQNIDLYKRLVRVFLERADYANAISWLDKAALLPQAEGDLSLKQTRSEVAIKATESELQKLRSDSSSNPKRAKQNGIRIQILEREFEGLRLEESRKMVEQFPNDYGQRLNYGELLLNAGEVDNAIKQFQVSQRSTSLRQKSCVLLGRSFFRKGLFDLALEQFDKAVEGAPTMDDFKKDVIYSSAQCCEKLGMDEEAVRRYKTIYANDISFRDVAEKIGAHYSDGDR